MTHTREAVELDVVLGGQFGQSALGLAPQGCGFHKSRVKGLHRLARRLEQFAHQGITFRVGIRRAAFLHLSQPMLQGLDQQHTPLRVVQQVILQIGVALHHPNITQHLVQHARRATGAALVAQAVEQFPGRGAEQTDDDFAVRKRGVVVGNFANAGVRVRHMRLSGHELIELNGGVHRVL